MPVSPTAAARAAVAAAAAEAEQGPTADASPDRFGPVKVKRRKKLSDIPAATADVVQGPALRDVMDEEQVRGLGILPLRATGEAAAVGTEVAGQPAAQAAGRIAGEAAAEGAYMTAAGVAAQASAEAGLSAGKPGVAVAAGEPQAPQAALLAAKSGDQALAHVGPAVVSSADAAGAPLHPAAAAIAVSAAGIEAAPEESHVAVAGGQPQASSLVQLAAGAGGHGLVYTVPSMVPQVPPAQGAQGGAAPPVLVTGVPRTAPSPLTAVAGTGTAGEGLEHRQNGIPEAGPHTSDAAALAAAAEELLGLLGGAPAVGFHAGVGALRPIDPVRPKESAIWSMQPPAEAAQAGLHAGRRVSSEDVQQEEGYRPS